MIPKAVREEALAIAGGLYSLNARYAAFYAFSWDPDRHRITNGEHVAADEARDCFRYYGAFLVLGTREFHEVHAGDVFRMVDGFLVRGNGGEVEAVWSGSRKSLCGEAAKTAIKKFIETTKV